jgi:ADP-ribose pyrophosphatase YjhB (NUDIX family)
MNDLWLDFAKKVHAIAETGLTYKNNEYDSERYEQLKDLSFRMLSELSEQSVEIIQNLFSNAKGYQTPKVDVRGVVFNQEKILLVKEKVDECWTLPGGWADVGLTPKENVVKEVWEEAGLIVEPERLLAIFDKKCHEHPPTPWYCYKIIMLCNQTGGMLKVGMETLDVGYFSKDNLPPLSTERITKGQIDHIYELALCKDKVWCD